MTKPLVAERKGHPKDQKLSEALEEDKARRKAQKGIISKQATLVTAGISDGELQKVVGGTMAPDADQLERINRLVPKGVTADEVVTFNTLSCNDLVDRDDDQFTKQCVKDFAELPQPFSPIGKSYMLDHEYSVKNAVGRIYGANTKSVSTEQGKALFLTNEVYLPNTEQFQPLIEKIDFGIAWAVSVGVMLGKDACSVCGSGFSSWGYWCREGHDKGLFYDPNSDETDSWGYPEPCDPNAPGAVKCIRQFMEPRDFYELSQVFLGAQYYAALEDKTPELAGALKSAKGSFVSASEEEARELPLRHEPKKLSEARTKGIEIEKNDDGSLVWTDEASLVWTFDPEDPETGVLCLGKSNSDNSEEEEDGTATGDELSDPEGEGVGGNADDGGNSSDAESAEDGEGELSGEGSSSSVDDEEPEAVEDDNEEEKSLSKKSVLKAVKDAKLPEALVKTVEDSEGNGLDALLLAVSTETKALHVKASLGDAYLKELRAEAINWYVKAHATGDTKAISTETFERMLDRFDDDVDLFHSVIEENKALAREKFPKEVRRSTFQIDVNERKELDDPTFHTENDEKVRKIHG